MFYLSLRKHRCSLVKFIAAAGIILPVLSSCNATKYLKDNEYLYKSSSVTYTNVQSPDIDTTALADDLTDLSKLKPNEKTLGVFPLKTSLYMIGTRGIDQYIKYQEVNDTRFFFVFDYDTLLKSIKPLADDSSGFRKWLTTKAGRAPQLIDTFAIEETNSRISNYLYNRGFFYASSLYSVEYDTKKQKGNVIYHVNLGTLSKMRTITYEISDQVLAARIRQIRQESQLKPGQPIDVELLKSERNRISNNLRNVGYYKFQKEYIYFEVDTSRNDSLDIYVRISMPAGDSVHHPYKIRNIYVYPDPSSNYTEGFEQLNSYHYVDSTKIRRVDKKKVLTAYIATDTSAIADTYMERLNDKDFVEEQLKVYVAQDTTSGKAFYVNGNGQLKKTKRNKLRSDYYYVSDKKRYNKKAIGNNIFVNPETYYSDSLTQKTIAAFSNVGIFAFVSVQPTEIYDSTGFVRYVDMLIKLEPAPRKSFSAEINANTTADHLLGNAASVSYTQKNLFKSLDQIKFNVKGGIETQLGGEQTYINTSELNAGVTLSIPRLGWPLDIEVPKRYYPVTNVALNFNYIDQINDFTLINTSFEYSNSVFENTRKKQHIFKFPIPSINIVKVPRISDAFREELEQNPLLKQSFEEVIITGYGYTFILNTQAEGLHFYDKYLRASAEINAPFSDFFRVDADFRNYLNFNKANHLVLRAAAGFADPWGKPGNEILNTTVIPYVKQFFSGGAYSVRAFPVRKLGPGAYVDYDTTNSLRVDQVADMKLEFNVEYRFDIISFLEGAIFCDFGNTWTLRDDPFRPNAQFQVSDFYREIAVGPGVGLRLDFSYFIIRFDGAYPLYDPALDGPGGNEYRSYYESIGFEIPRKTIALNFAIGYPF